MKKNIRLIVVLLVIVLISTAIMSCTPKAPAVQDVPASEEKTENPPSGAKPLTGEASGFGDQFKEYYDEVIGLSGEAAFDYFMTLKDKGLTDREILKFFIHLPLADVDSDAKSLYVSDALDTYTVNYPYGATVDNYVWVPGTGTEFTGPLTKVLQKLPYTDYMALPAGKVGDPNKTYKVGVLTSGVRHPWGAAVSDAMLWQMNQFENIEVNYQEHLADDAKLSSIMDTFIAQKMDAIYLFPRGEAASGPAVRRALDAGIPVVAVDTLTGATNITVQVAGNFPSNGAQNAMYLIDQLHQEGSFEANMIFLRKPLGATNDALRTGHFLKVLSYFPEIKILQSYFDKNNRTEAFDNAQAALMAYDDIDIFMNLGDHEALAAIEAINLAGRMNSREGGKKIIILSNNDSRELLSKITSNDLDCAAPSTPLMGDIGSRMVARILAGETVPQYVVNPDILLITQDGRSLFGMKTMLVEDWIEYAYGPAVD